MLSSHRSDEPKKSSLFSFFSKRNASFDYKQFEKALKEGHIEFLQESRYEHEKEKIFIRIKDSGSNLVSFREVMSECIAANFDGIIEADAYRRSHLDYLKLGFVPLERLISAHGLYGESIATELLACTNLTDLQKKSRSFIEGMKEILRTELNTPEEKDISIEDVFKNRDVLIKHYNKKVSYITEYFIPFLVDSLKRNSGKICPDTSYMGSVIMILSPEGKARWCDAIKQNKEFVPFTDLSHLKLFLIDKEKISEFEQVVAQYRKSLETDKTINLEAKAFSLRPI